MSPGPPQRPELITDAPGLVRVVEALLKEGCIALDTESDGFHRYPEKICLVQLASRDRVYIVDPLTIGDMMPLERLLADRRVEKVIHSAENDLRIVDRHWGYRIFNLYDTSVGAHFLGMERLGLGAIAEEFLGVQLDKSKKLQRADWSLRPLSDTAIDYAAADVAHLVALRDALEHFPGLVVEVHLTNIFARDAFRHESVTAPVAAGVVSGLGWRGYLAALDALVGLLHEKRGS